MIIAMATSNLCGVRISRKFNIIIQVTIGNTIMKDNKPLSTQRRKTFDKTHLLGNVPTV